MFKNLQPPTIFEHLISVNVHRYVFLFLFLGACIKVNASTVTAIASGDWSTDENWDPMGAPGCYDTIIIPAGIVIDVADQTDLTACPATYILVQGELHFVSGKKLDLPCGSAVFMDPGPPAGTLTAGGGGGNSNYIKICNTTYWSAADGDLTGPALLCEFCLLPIELVSFSAVLTENMVTLNWQTASELNNAFFTVERSYNGEDWIEINEIPGAGNSSIAIFYEDYDRNPLPGVSYYRLKQTDFDGNYSYSNTIAINNEYHNGNIEIFPNPVNQNSDITVFIPKSSEQFSTISVYTIDGRLLYTQAFEFQDKMGVVIELDYSFTAGTYLVKSGLTTEKLVVR